ncbi:MAG TPA: hypothetical protein V6D47_02515 [Oscillatoriaceae cyanobacterium]
MALPESELNELTRLAEIAGTTVEVELARDLALTLELDGEHARDLEAERLEEVAGLVEPWHPVRLALPEKEWQRITALADAHRTTPSVAMAGMTRHMVHALLRIEIRALERRQPLAEAFADIIAEDTAA